MRRAIALAMLVIVVFGGACTKKNATPTETVPPLTATDLERGLLTQTDVGSDWAKESAPDLTTVQIGGRVGPANVDHDSAQATSAFTQKTGSGSISDSVFLIRTVALARAIMKAHRSAGATTTWTQDRDDGSHATFKSIGPLPTLPTLGDEVFSEAIKVTIKDSEAKTTTRGVHYVVYRIGAVLGFVVTQDVSVVSYASRQERRVASLL